MDVSTWELICCLVLFMGILVVMLVMAVQDMAKERGFRNKLLCLLNYILLFIAGGV